MSIRKDGVSKGSSGSGRSRTFTGCGTCRSRHLKCDEARPVCSSCRRLNLACQGYTAELLWVAKPSADQGQSHRANAYRHPLFTEDYRKCMSIDILASIGGRSTDDALLSLEEKQVADGDSHTLGPFGVFKAFDGPPSPPHTERPADVNPTVALLGQSAVGDGADVAAGGIQDEDDVEDVFPTQTWPLDSDPTSLGPDLSVFDYLDLQPAPPHPFSIDLNNPWMNVEGNPEPTQMLACHGTGLNTLFSPSQPSQPPSTQILDAETVQCADKTRGEVLTELSSDTQFSIPTNCSVPSPQNVSLCGTASAMPNHAATLLRYYRENLVENKFIAMGRLSPWKILVQPCALETFAELSLFNSASHTRLSILYTVLAISAFHIHRSKASRGEKSPWLQVATDHQRAAQNHLKSALKKETGLDSLGRYTEILMAILSISIISVLLHDSRAVKAFLIDAERLIRTRGLQMRKSFNLRILHHMYTHVRILAESTDVTMEHGVEAASLPSLPSPTAIITAAAPDTDMGTNTNTACMPPSMGFRRFRVSEDCLGSDLDLEREKPAEIGYRDIHLEISGQWHATMYPDIYGIPESLMTLLSQTISLANGKAKLEALAMHDYRISSALSQHIRTLEQNIWQWSGSGLPAGPDRPPGLFEKEGGDTRLLDQPYARSIVFAIHQALIIYFYRRVYNMNAMVVQDSVRRTLEYIDPCIREEDTNDQDFATSIGWCAFMAACEAATPALQERSLRCLEAVADRAGLFGAEKPCEIVKTVWKRRQQSGDLTFSWPDVMRLQVAGSSVNVS